MNDNIKSTISWPWYKVWTRTLFRPVPATGEALLSEGNISLRQAILWLVSAALAEASIRWLLPLFLFKNQPEINWQTIFKLLSGLVLSSLVIPFIVFIFCWVIHLIAKLFRSKGTLQNFFIVYAAFAAPLWILVGLSTVIYWDFKIEAFALVCAFLELYWLFVVNSVVIKSVYRFSWVGTCSITLLITIAGFVFAMFEIYNTFITKLPH